MASSWGISWLTSWLGWGVSEVNPNDMRGSTSLSVYGSGTLTNATPEVIAPPTGPSGGSTQRKRRRKPQYCKPGENIPWGMNSDLLLALLPDETPQEVAVVDKIENWVENSTLELNNLDDLLKAVSLAAQQLQSLPKAPEIDVEAIRAETRRRHAAVIKRKREEEAVIYFLINEGLL